MEYLEFFGLNEDPFRLTPDPFYFYPSEEHNRILSSLAYAVEQKEGFFLATGEPGTGKTTLLNRFLSTEGLKERAGIALVLTPTLSPEEFLLTILEDLEVEVRERNKNAVLKTFRDFLIGNSRQGRRIIIIVDEAQNLPAETLEELRLLSNLETEKEKLLQIVLMGQSELKKRLLSDSLKQLNQRITMRAEFRPLNRSETSEYINFRLIKAGKGAASFDEAAKRRIHTLSRGIPRLINLLSSRSMMAAYLDASRNVRKRHVEHAARHVADSAAPGKGGVRRLRLRFAAPLLFFALAALSAAVAYQFFPLPAGVKSAAPALPAPSAAPPVIVLQESVRQPGASPAPAAAAPAPSAPAVSPGAGGTLNEKSVPARDSAPPLSPAAPPASHEQGRKEAREKVITVRVRSATLREFPALGAPPVTWVSRGAVLEAQEETMVEGKRWFRIITTSGREGWISEKVVAE
ncbi:MAG: AAA family ATPase [Thermodesulfovibrionales bacterium]